MPCALLMVQTSTLSPARGYGRVYLLHSEPFSLVLHPQEALLHRSRLQAVVGSQDSGGSA